MVKRVWCQVAALLLLLTLLAPTALAAAPRGGRLEEPTIAATLWRVVHDFFALIFFATAADPDAVGDPASAEPPPSTQGDSGIVADPWG